MKTRPLTNRCLRFLAISVFVLLPTANLLSQNKVDSVYDDVKNNVLNRLKNFSFGFYVDAYYNYTLGNKGDTSSIIPYSGNCPVPDQVRMNHAAIEIYYNAEKVRGKLILQYGDAPNLLAAPNAQFIKNLRQANFGFRLAKKLWFDAGYFLNPVGVESAWAVINQLSTVTICGYFEPGSLLGTKLTWSPSDKFNGGLMVGNSYSVAYGKNQHTAGVVFLNFFPTKNLTFSINSFFGNQALVNAAIDNDICYNNLIVQYSPVKHLDLTGQFDFAFETNIHLPPDTSKLSGMFSGFVMARYTFGEHVALTARYEFFNDPQGFLSGVYTYDDKMTGLATNGFTGGVEYKPVKFGYVRLEYRYLAAQKGNLVYSGNTSNTFQALTLTTGMRF